MSFVANFIRFQAMQKFWESLKIWPGYREFKGRNFFETQCGFVLKLVATQLGHFFVYSLLCVCVCVAGLWLISGSIVVRAVSNNNTVYRRWCWTYARCRCIVRSLYLFQMCQYFYNDS